MTNTCLIVTFYVNRIGTYTQNLPFTLVMAKILIFRFFYYKYFMKLLIVFPHLTRKYVFPLSNNKSNDFFVFLLEYI